MPTPGCVPRTMESPYVPSQSAPFATKCMVKRTDSRVRKMAVQIQPQHLPPCDFKPAPQLSALQGGHGYLPWVGVGVAAGMCEKACGPRAPGLACGRVVSCSSHPTEPPCVCWDNLWPWLRSTLEGHVWFGGFYFGSSRTNTRRGLGTQPLWRGLKRSYTWGFRDGLCPQGPGPLIRSEAPGGPDGVLRVTELLDPYFSDTVKGIPSISQLFSESSFLLPAVSSLPHRSPGPPLLFFPPKSASESPSPAKK